MLDFDTALSFQTPLATYLEQSFPISTVLSSNYAPLFRVVGANDFIKHFASDRSHMQNSEGSWQMPPPPWPLCQNDTDGMNLMEFVAMSSPSDDQFIGNVMTLLSLQRKFGLSS